MNKKWYITTPIYYVTARPHLGSLYSTLIADAIARWHRLEKRDVYFLTGTDEHGQKVAQAAQKAGMNPKEFVDGFIDAYKNTWHKYHIEYTGFIRTTDSYHVKAVQEWLRQLLAQGDIYKGEYAGWYCVPCETFVTQEIGREQQAPLCSSCARETGYVAEETYFFRLSHYQQRLLDFYEENPDFIVPHARRNEVINFVKEGLKDLSISRTTVQWGIPFPDDERHICYVWADALNNYITAVGYGDTNRANEFKKWWPVDTQVMGKDIIRFHAIYWPAFLMAAGLALPRQLLVHGWIQVDKQKMSKSFGNVVDPMDLYNAYGPDEVRYYLLRHMAITQDGEFSIEHLEEALTTDLANNLGNLVQRIVTLAHKFDNTIVKPPVQWAASAHELRDACMRMISEVRLYMTDYSLHMALATIMKYISTVNAYVHAQEPWKYGKTERERFQETVSAVCHALHGVAVLLWPFMPVKMEQLCARLGVSIDRASDNLTQLTVDRWGRTYNLPVDKEPLFRKFDEKRASKDAIEVVSLLKESKQADAEIDIADFSKVIVAVGTILACEVVEGSDKLLKLQVDCGSYGVRQIISGVRKHFHPEQLIGKQGVFVVNLKPRKMAGLLSAGMMLFAQDDGGALRMVTVDGQVPAGAVVR